MPSRPVLIGRGLVTHPPHYTRMLRVHYPESEPTTHPGQQHRGTRVTSHKRTTVHHVTAAIAAGKHPDPSRTRKLSQPAPMVLHPTGCGRVGRRRTYLRKRGHHCGGPFSAFPHPVRVGLGRRFRAAFRPQGAFRHHSSTGAGGAGPPCRSRPRGWRARRWCAWKRSRVRSTRSTR